MCSIPVLEKAFQLPVVIVLHEKQYLRQVTEGLRFMEAGDHHRLHAGPFSGLHTFGSVFEHQAVAMGHPN